jgi:hypothetical protein
LSSLDRRHPFASSPYFWAAVLTGLLSGVVFALTCFRTVTWWDSVNYTIAASALGVPAPPGSLVATLVGWAVTHLTSTAHQAFALNLLAAILGAITAGLVTRTALFMVHSHERAIPELSKLIGMTAFGAMIGGLTLAVSDTLWLHATKFTPYIFTACLTAILLGQLVRWWQEADSPGENRRMLLIIFLLGLDLSVHRTNLLLTPGIVLWILLRKPGLLGSWRNWLFGLGAFAAAAALQLLLMPIAAAHPALNFNDPSTLARFWDYISLKQFGGGWLISLYPRKAPFWEYQLADYLKIFRHNFMPVEPVGNILGFLPLVFGCVGIVSLWRANWKLAFGVTALFLCASLGAVIYFNIPADFFRSFDRHYLPSFVVFGAWIAYGLAASCVWLVRSIERSGSKILLLMLLAVVTVPWLQYARNWESHDGSRNYFAYDFSKNLLATIPAGGIVLTYGDSDTFPLWYLQKVEHLRPDVTVINIWLLNTSWYVSQVLSEDPLLPLTLTEPQLLQIAPRKWADTVLKISVAGNKSDTAQFHIPPVIQGAYLMPHDWLIAQMIAENHFRRPIYVSASGGSNIVPWIAVHLRSEGLALRLMPDSGASADISILRHNLFDAYSYRGWDDSSVAIDDASGSMAPIYWQMFAQYLQDLSQRTDSSIFRSDRDRLMALIPPSRCPGLPEPLTQWLKSTSP